MSELSPELQELASELGVDTSQVGVSGGGASEAPSVYLGADGRPGTPDAVAPVDTLLSDLFKMKEDRLRDLQRQLFDGGFFGSVPAERIGWGTADESTVAAYDVALRRSALYYEAGVKKTPSQIIKEAGGARQEAEEGFRQGVSGGGNVYTVNLSDPASLRSLADKVSSAVLGRKATPEVEKKIADAVRASQAGEQGKVNQARESAARREFTARQGAVQGQSGFIPGETVTSEQVDPEARAEEMLRSEFPLEAAGMDAADGYRTFLGLLAPGGIR